MCGRTRSLMSSQNAPIPVAHARVVGRAGAVTSGPDRLGAALAGVAGGPQAARRSPAAIRDFNVGSDHTRPAACPAVMNANAANATRFRAPWARIERVT